MGSSLLKLAQNSYSTVSKLIAYDYKLVNKFAYQVSYSDKLNMM